MKELKRCWIAMFSQTGSELQEVCKRLNQWPDVVITNAADVDVAKWSNSMLVKIDASKKVDSKMYMHLLDFFAAGADPLVTLHGWLKIVPGDVCEKYQIFNGHPGNIKKFPQLKGKDPQKKAFELKLPFSGCVIHRVTSEVDGGPIVLHEEVAIAQCKSVDQVIATLKKTSIEQWIKLLKTLI
jgi:folate-dependent phosphoribosylglycinamide formyltransferase PurN